MEQNFIPCDKDVKCWDYSTRKCKREKGHDLGCNPFSNSYPVNKTLSQKEEKVVSMPVSFFKPYSVKKLIAL